MDINELNKALRIQMISCPSFDCMLYYDPDTKEYSTTKEGVITVNDPRLIAYLEILPTLKPVNWL